MGFGNGAFQAARITIDGVTIIQNIETGKIQTGANVGVTVTAVNKSTLAIPIANNQNVATPAPFQQIIQINLHQYPQLEGIASDLSNIYFSSDEAGQNKLYSWRETPASLTEMQTWWVLLPNGIPANSTITIYLQVSSSTALDGVYTGEAPQLSSTYGQYDNGANIFPAYWNFAGTSLPSGWNLSNWNPLSGQVSITVNNGLTFSLASGGNNVSLYWGSNFTAPAVFDWYGTPYTPSANYYTGGNANNGGWGFGLGNEGGDVGENPQVGMGSNIGTSNYYLDGNSSLSANWPVNPPTTGVYTVINANTAVGMLNYENPVSQSITPKNLNIGWGFGYNSSNLTYTIQWARIRAYPPNGVMPSIPALIEEIQNIITTSSNTWQSPQTYTATQNINVSQTTISGTTAGSITYSMPYQGSSYKKFIAYANGYENFTNTAQIITFPVSFSTTPNITTVPPGLILNVSPTGITLSTATIAKVPITITNNQTSATPAPFQQQIVINPSNYSSYLASDLSNANFQDENGNILNSWLESGNSNTSTSAIYWVVLPNGIPASSSITIYYCIYPTNANMFNATNTGEAPQLSSTYAQYDNGANIFSYYQAFGGLNTLPGGWSSYNYLFPQFYSTYMEVFANAYDVYSGMYLNPLPSSLSSTSTIWEFYGNMYQSTPPGYDPTYVGTATGTGGNYSGYAFSEGNNPTNLIYLTNSGTLFDVSTGYDDTNNNKVYTMQMNSATSLQMFINYTQIYSTTSATAESPTYFGFYVTGNHTGYSSTPISLYWLRTRALPPNGVMPSTSFGSLYTITTMRSYSGLIIIEGY